MIYGKTENQLRFFLWQPQQRLLHRNSVTKHNVSHKVFGKLTLKWQRMCYIRHCSNSSNWYPSTRLQPQKLLFHSSVASSTMVCCRTDQPSNRYCFLLIHILEDREQWREGVDNLIEAAMTDNSWMLIQTWPDRSSDFCALVWNWRKTPECAVGSSSYNRDKSSAEAD